MGKYLYWGIAAIAVIMGLSLFGLFEIKMPFRSELKTSVGGLLGAFLLGMLFGLASTPCATPVLVVILTFAASKGQVAYSTFLLFVYAIGHCALVILAGVMTGFVDSLAQSRGAARFIAISRKVAAILLVFAGFYIFYMNL
jgi:cytochrome c biogenesis protein CcdA